MLQTARAFWAHPWCSVLANGVKQGWYGRKSSQWQAA
jgi:hypothetical protein